LYIINKQLLKFLFHLVCKLNEILQQTRATDKHMHARVISINVQFKNTIAIMNV